MAYTPKDGDISIFKNENRTKDTHPTHRGTMQWNGEKLKISLWPKQGDKGPFLSGRVETDDYVKPESVPASAVDDFIAPAQSDPAQTEPIPGVDNGTDDLPF